MKFEFCAHLSKFQVKATAGWAAEDVVSFLCDVQVYPLVAPVPGSFLISSPMMPDDRFRKKVVFLCNQDEEGFKGLVLDNPMPQKLASMLSKSNRCVESRRRRMHLVH